jgi:sulfite dehydrogenase (cytochrome) subunit B
MKPTLSLASAALIALGVSTSGLVMAWAKPVSYRLPEETAKLKPAANVEIVQNNCTACHSTDYIETQPRALKSKKDFWQAEVTKMIKVYGAPIDEGDVGKIVDYLAANYGLGGVEAPAPLGPAPRPPLRDVSTTTRDAATREQTSARPD